MSYYESDPPSLYCTRCGGPAVAEDLCSAHLDDYYAALDGEAAARTAAVEAEVADWRRGYAGRSYDELAESHWMGCETYADMSAEYRSEVSHFGDAWPGSAGQLASLKAHLDLLDELMAAHPDRPAPAAPTTPVMSELSDEEPF